jgi:hypothetical protein
MTVMAGGNVLPFKSRKVHYHANNGSQVRDFLTFSNLLFFLRSGVTGHCPVHMLEAHSFSAVRDCLFSTFTAAFNICKTTPQFASCERTRLWWQELTAGERRLCTTVSLPLAIGQLCLSNSPQHVYIFVKFNIWEFYGILPTFRFHLKSDKHFALMTYVHSPEYVVIGLYNWEAAFSVR